ncbi:MAG: enoyl-CoA hydratase/isomerase family protein [Euryarchaeota archaeon]|nr:enoyl-CoA hydratase/isomerase family protein [Euryarchaeota archaeon]MDE1835869.1 enoyl-CoA hydratase/isomerase family protein [Euryarchaeota archaeon]MDE1882119.1 enoyl-CoA hydratase/isomerase family protein [Euryarchaeota archaeon]MDE2044453.1 enoyl-CoA hydratase/isomerase family protein [Thermoplasmata archaeon]
MPYEHINVKKEEDGVVILSLKNPPMNALSTSLVKELAEATKEIGADPTVRAVVLTGEGQYFCVGADVKEMAAMAMSGNFIEEAPKVVERGHAAFSALESLPQPVIAAVNGMALGGGLELAISADIRIAGDSTKLGAPEVTLGLIPAYGGTQRLPRLVGLAKANELILTGSMIPGPEALKIGLVNKVVPAGQELRAARDLAHTIGAKCSPPAVSAAKAAIRQGLSKPLSEGLKGEAEIFQKKVLPSEDLAEGITAFSEKRPPKYKGK